MRTPGASATGTRHHWLLAAKVAWVFVTLAGLLITFASVPILYVQYGTPCTETFERCLELARLTPEGSLMLAQAGISPQLYAALAVAAGMVSALVWVSVGLLVFLLRSGDRMALLVSFFLITFGTATYATDPVEALGSVHLTWMILGKALQVLGELCVVLFFLLFPSGTFVPRWTRWLGGAFLAFQIPRDLFPNVYRLLGLEPVQGTVFVALVFGMLGAQVYRYRKVSSPREQNQTKWVVAGTTLALVALFAVFLPFSFIGLDIIQTSPFVLLVIQLGYPFIMTLIPLSIGIAMLRSRLFDIDIIINRTLVYGTLTAILIVFYFGSVVVLRELFAPFAAGNSQVSIVTSTLAIAALFNPLRRRIQTLIDRRFYRHKYDTQQTMARFSARLRDETDLIQLRDDLVGIVQDTLQPASMQLWLRDFSDAPRYAHQPQHTANAASSGITSAGGGES